MPIVSPEEAPPSPRGCQQEGRKARRETDPESRRGKGAGAEAHVGRTEQLNLQSGPGPAGKASREEM